MKPFLDKIISPNQTAFLKGKWINENVVLAQEVLHTMNKTKSNKGWLGIKIDFSEGFYRVEWSFLREILKHLGFH